MQPLFLKVFYQGKLLKVCPFTDNQISIGSGEGLSLKLKNLAPWHVIIEKKWDRCTIFDLGSDTGTFVNEQKIAGEHTLESGSSFQIGPYHIQFFVGPPPEGFPSPGHPLSKQEVVEKKPQSSEKTFESSAVAKESSALKMKQESQIPVVESEPAAASTESAASDDDKTPTEKPLAEKSPPFGIPRPPIEEATKDILQPPQQAPAKVFEKPQGKGYWRTFAPSDKVKNLDEYLEPSVGNFIEVLVSWKNRILDSFHFFKKGQVYLGSSKNCQVPVSNLLGLSKYKLLEIDAGAKVFLDHGVTGALIQKKGEQGQITHPLPGNQSLVLKPHEIIRLDFKNLLRAYVRIKQRPTAVAPQGLLHLTFSETAVLFFSFLTTGLLLFYAGLYAPAFLQKPEDFLEKNIVQAVVKFEKKPPPAKPRVVKMQLADKTRARKKKAVVRQKRKVIKKPSPKPVVIRKSKKPKTVPKKTAGLKKRGKRPGKIGAVAKGRKPPAKQKIAAGSARPGGSLKTGKSGATAKTRAPDPTKTGLLGVFGGGGKLKKLDTGATGSAAGGLLGLAETSTGFAGTKEGYEGEGVGTKTKELATGGEGTQLVGIKGIKTKGRGGNLLGQGRGRGGSLGSRGRVNINIGADDIEVEGSIDKAGILRVLKRNRIKFDKCYQFSLQSKSSLKGSLKMEWQILPNGSVKGARPLRDTVGSSSLSDCMRRALRRLRFPAPPSSQIPKVSFNFVFSI